MPDTDAPSRSEPNRSEQSSSEPSRSEPPTSAERTNLPVPVPQQASEPPRQNGEPWLARALRILFGWKAATMRADLEVVLDADPTGETGFSPTERTMLKNILDLRESRVDDVMIPRADIVAVQQDIPLGELMRLFESAGHSRLVVYNDTLDDAIGMVHIRDLLAYVTARAVIGPDTKTKRKKMLPAGLNFKAVDLSVPLSSSKLVRTILFVPPSMPAIELLAKMQATRIHLALVVDEYGGTDGIVSMEDIVEQIVGEIADEHDEATTVAVIPQSDGSFLADARASLEDVVATVGAEFDVGEVAEEVDTLGGYLATRAGRVPVRGELVPGPEGFEIEVLDADPRRVKKVKIYRSKNREGGGRELRRRERRPDEDARKDVTAPPPVPDASSRPQTAHPPDAAAS